MGTTWTDVKDVPEFGRGTGLDTVHPPTRWSAWAVRWRKYVKLTILSQWGVVHNAV